MSVLSHLYQTPRELPRDVKVLYTTRPGSNNLHEILFYQRIASLIAGDPSPDRTLDMYITGQVVGEMAKTQGDGSVKIHQRRISHEDLEQAVGPVDSRAGVVVYVCGPAKMTDEYVEVLQRMEGMNEERVLFERWW
jgi:hypothetical protein